MTDGHPRIPGAKTPPEKDRITSGVDFVQRWEARILFAGLLSGSRAHHILLEVTRRLVKDAPPDLEAGFARLYEMQQFLNAMGQAGDGHPEIPVPVMLEFLDALKTMLTCHRDAHADAVITAPAVAPTRILLQGKR